MKPSFHVVIDIQNPESHRIKVSIYALDDAKLPEILRFPVWTPGSYLVRDYARHITNLTPGEKIERSAWRLSGPRKHVSFEVYAFERTVRTPFVDARYAALVGAALMPLLHAPFTVELLLPKSWTTVSSALKFRRQAPGKWIANVKNDDHWIDSPIVAASPGYGEITSFTHQGIRHHIAWVGTECARSNADLKKDFAKIVDATLKFFGGAPFKEYWFLLHFGTKLYGGLEHRDSQLSQFDGSSLADDKEYDAFLRLIAHEYFHAWNVKSLRPRALGPFDYSMENLTEDLWFAEGITDYFDDMIPLQAGLLSEENYKKSRLKSVQGMNDGLPGQKRRSVADSSFDAWIRHYKPDEDTDNTDVSYYTKGALLGWCWDAELQKRTRGRHTLAKLMRSFWEHFGIDAYEDLQEAKPGYTRRELLAYAEKITGVSHAFVEAWVTAKKPLPWEAAAKYFRIPFTVKVQDPLLHFSGAQIQWRAGQAILSKVMSGSAAESAGLAPGDEIVAFNDWRASENERVLLRWKRVLESKKPVKVLVSRMERLSVLEFRPKSHPGLGISAELKSES